MDLLQFFCNEDQEVFQSSSANSTSLPLLNECVLHGSLIFLPCWFFLFFLPLICFDITKDDKKQKLRLDTPINYRLFLSVILDLIIWVMLLNAFHETYIRPLPLSTDDWKEIAPYAALAIVFTISIYVSYRVKQKGILTSGVLFIFYFLLTVCALPELLYILQEIGEGNKLLVHSILFIPYFVLNFLILVLSCFADIPKQKYDKKKACPEEYSSFLNQISFHWFTQMTWTGYKQSLKMENMWDLNTNDESSMLLQEYEGHRRKEEIAHARKHYHKQVPNGKQQLLENYQKPQEEGDKKKEKAQFPSILMPLTKCFKFSLISGALLKFIFDSAQFVFPHLLKMLIRFIQNGTDPKWYGIGIAVTMLFIGVVQSFILHQYFHIMFHTGMKIRSILSSVVYKKAINLSSKARKNRTVGSLVNIMAADVQRFQDVTTYVMMLWSAPYQMILAMYFLYQVLGWSVICGVLIMASLIPINSNIAKAMQKYQAQQMECKDKRLRMLNEVISGMKLVKLYGWEEEVKQKILDEREKEIRILRKLAYWNAATSLTWACAPFLVAVTTFSVYVFVDPANNLLTPEKTFVALALFNILRFPMAVCTVLCTQVAQFRVSNDRLKEFLAAEEVDRAKSRRYDVSKGLISEDPEKPRHTTSTTQPNAVTLTNASFAWDPEDAYGTALSDLNLTIEHGKLVAVIGRVGSGKTSLIQALLGEMYKVHGTCELNGRVAYVPQQSWILNMTVRDNILFGSIYDETKYYKIIEACALEQDLRSLSNGDMTEIGEKGINLSGGQKQRISLARALYADADIYLLDDVLSAVDAHVQRHLFDHVILDLLKDKTRFLVTNSLTNLKHCDQVVVMKGGQVSEFGTYEGLIQKHGEFSEIVEEFLIEEAKSRGRSISFGEDSTDVKEVLEELQDLLPKEKLTPESIETKLNTTSNEKKLSSSSIPTITITAPTANNTPKFQNHLTKPQNGAPPAPKRLIEGENVETGQVKLHVYYTYIKSIGLACVTIFLAAYVFSSALGILSNMWLAHWSDKAVRMRNSNSTQPDMASNLGIYTMLGLGQALAVCIAAVWVSLGMVKASKLLHSKMLDGVVSKPMWFFDITPMGRILNRFSKDLDMIDSRLPSSVLNFTGSIIQALAILCVPIIITPQVTPSIVAILVIYCFLTVFYLSTSRQLKRLEAVTRSPIYSHFAESINGSASIRAFNCEDRFVRRSQQLVDENLKAYYPSIVANRWLSVRLELIGNLIVFFSGIFAVLYSDNGVTAGLIGLSVSYAFNVTQVLNWAVRMSSELETNIVSVERVTEYAEQASEERDEEVQLAVEPLSGWPTNGQISFEMASFSYRPDSDEILKNINLKINAKEKIAIVGRTGSGKSSFALALFRLLESKSGRITIDNVDLSKVPLPTLRRRLTIVPQDPVLFSGTLRMNLDPSNLFDEEFLWEALEYAGMKQFVASLPNALETEISEGGANISVGQRQLICLARALLRKPKILILDEASASVDLETDQMVHRTLRDHFADCTVLTIAHRLNWLSDVDRVLVIDNGMVAEFDTPDNLLKRDDSLFKSLANEGDFTMKKVSQASVDRMTPPRVEITPAEAEESTDPNNEGEDAPLLDNTVDSESVESG
ncbi:unnamed protein product [Bursaphelenchus okinawaensis]|uniref:ABC-type glutathione-S-conjugate transporter n=1 Tax=Bursaphelenchus okinawaensis TaxID=465554 RepID=A0A811KQQ5_9BILA|nr:unnamed protein product [Bursaphelenchus okinawaensis]CAG9108151.1 unnamed protein product [Bursaphelenchus okinawaensis]